MREKGGSGATTLIAVVMLACLCGCLPGPSFRMVESRVKRIDPAAVRDSRMRLPTRDWVDAVHGELRPLLPELAQPVLTTDDMKRADGATRNIYRAYRLDPARLDSLIGNFDGVMTTAKVVLRHDTPSSRDWPGYKSVEIPTDDGVMLCGRLAGPLKNDLGGSYIVITHGLFGRQGGSDQFNLAHALRSFGHHVLLLDMRGHGDTKRRHPEQPYTFGLDEPFDLLATSRWLRSECGAQRIGLVSFSITAQHAMLAAWLDGDGTLAGNPHSPILQLARAPDPLPQFDAGILAISPVLNMTEYADSLERRRGIWDSPVRAVFQSQVEAQFKGMRGTSRAWRMWAFMKHELKRSRWMEVYPDFQMLFSEEMRFVNLSGGSHAGAQRMERVRVPLLVLHSANDPVGGSAQAVADIFGEVKNPNCGVMMMRQGGHTGFSALAPVHYYTLVRAFFDPATSPRTVHLTSDFALGDSPEAQPANSVGR